MPNRTRHLKAVPDKENAARDQVRIERDRERRNQQLGDRIVEILRDTLNLWRLPKEQKP